MKDIQQKFDKIKQECIELSHREHNTLTQNIEGFQTQQTKFCQKIAKMKEKLVPVPKATQEQVDEMERVKEEVETQKKFTESFVGAKRNMGRVFDRMEEELLKLKRQKVWPPVP